MTSGNQKPKQRNVVVTALVLMWRGLCAFAGLIIKILTLLCLLALVGMAVVWFLFIKYFNTQEISQMVAEELQRLTGRPVAIGALDFKFFNYAKISNLVIFDLEATGGEPFFEAREVVFRYDPLPLIRRRHISIANISIRNPKITITKSENGEYNVPKIRLKNTGTVDVKTAGSPSRPFTVHVDDWEIEDGIFIFRDKGANTLHSVYNVNMKFNDLDFEKLSPFRASFVLRNSWKNKIMEASVKINGSVNFTNMEWQKMQLRDAAATVDFFKNPITLTLDLDNLTRPEITVTLKTPELTDEDLSLFLDKPLGVRFPQAEIFADMVLRRSYKYLVFNKLNLNALDIEAGGLGSLRFDEDNVRGDFDFKTNAFEIGGKEKFLPDLKKYAASGTAAINTAKIKFEGKKTDVPEFEIEIKKAAASLGGYNGGFKVSAATGKVYAKDNFKFLGAKSTTGTLKLGKQTFTGVDGKCEYDSKANKLNGLVTKAKLNGVPMKISTDITNFRNDKTRQITTKLYMETFDVMPFYHTVEDFVLAIDKPSKNPGAWLEKYKNDSLDWLHIFKDGVPEFMPNMRGFITADKFASPVLSGANFYMDFDLTGLLPGIKTLGGKIDLRLENGVIYQLEKRAAEEKALGIVFQPFIVMNKMEKAGSFKVGQILKDVAYSKIVLSTDLANGNMQILNFYSDGPTLGVAGIGWVDWANEKMDATVWTIFRNTSKSGALAESLTDASGAPALAFRIQDRMVSPKVEMLKPKTSGAEIKKVINRGIRADFAAASAFKPK